MDYKFCPLIKSGCKGNECAWWVEEKECVMLQFVWLADMCLGG